MRTLATLLVIAAPASAAVLASEDDDGALMEGLYLAGGGGPQLFITGENNSLGYDLEGRLGYSFNPRTQLYLSAAFDTTSISSISGQSIQIAVFFQYHVVARGRVLVYTRVGIGLGIVPGFVVPSPFSPDRQAGLGLAEAGGLGIEIRMSESVFLAPELFYRRATLSAAGVSGNVQMIGLQVALIYY